MKSPPPWRKGLEIQEEDLPEIEERWQKIQELANSPENKRGQEKGERFRVSSQLTAGNDDDSEDNPNINKITVLDAVNAANLDNAIAALALTFAFVIALLAIVKAPVLASVASPLKLTSAGLFVPSPTIIFALAMSSILDRVTALSVISFDNINDELPTA